MNTNETGYEYIARMAASSKTMGQKGRIAWGSIAMLVTADDLNEAVERGLVRVEDVPWRDGKTIKHIVAVEVQA